MNIVSELRIRVEIHYSVLLHRGILQEICIIMHDFLLDWI